MKNIYDWHPFWIVVLVGVTFEGIVEVAKIFIKG